MKGNYPWSSQNHSRSGPTHGDESETRRTEKKEKKRGLKLSERIERKPKTSLEDM